jgi:phosphohistidine phosphatase
MRHAKSSWKDIGVDDHDRPLNKRGVRDAPRMADAIHVRGWTPDLILVSSSKRTLQTLSGMEHRFNGIPSQIRSGIYLATVHDLLLEIEGMEEDSTTMILGHNPGSEMLIHHLTGDFIRMPTASAALLIESNGSWEVEGVIRPKEI